MTAHIATLISMIREFLTSEPIPAGLFGPQRRLAACPPPFAGLYSEKSRLGWCFGDAGRLYSFYCERCDVVVSEAQCT